MPHCPQHARSTPGPTCRSRAFTLIELLVVIGIIVVLIGILLPVVSRIRTAAQRADTQSFVNQLATAIERYQQDFRAYPGPLQNNEMDLIDGNIPYTNFIGTTFPGGFKFTSSAAAGVYDISGNPGDACSRFTMAENLVLGLLGGMHIDATVSTQLDYDPSAVGGGPVSLSTIAPPKRYPPYIDAKNLSWQPTPVAGATGLTGHFYDESGAANDSLIPCFIDRFTYPMPILYMRAKVGVNLTQGAVTGVTDYGDAYNPIVTDDLTETSAQYKTTPPTPAIRAGAYDISQIIAYVAPYGGGTWPFSLQRDPNWPPQSGAGKTPTYQSIGIGKSSPRQYTFSGANQYHGLFMSSWTSLAQPPPSMTNGSATYVYPYDAYPYLIGQAGGVRQKDSYILISAGPDRIYGTDDDICNFGTVGQ